MNKDQFRTALDALGLDYDGFSNLTGWSKATLYDWGARAPVPRPARCILVLLADRAGVSIAGQMVPPKTEGKRYDPAATADRFRI